MKTVIALLFFAFELHSQTIYLPDPALKARLLQNSASIQAASPNVFNTSADLDHDGEIDIAEAKLVFGLDLSHNGGPAIHSLEGLQHFVNLRVLICNGNALWSTAGIPQPVQVLEISWNNISEFNAQEFPQLQKLDCSSNPISTIDVDELWHLKEFKIRNTQVSELDCRMTGVVKLDCGDSPNLSYINIQNGQLWKSRKSSEFSPLQFDNLPSINQLCVDPGDAVWLPHSQCDLSQATVFTGTNCSAGNSR